MKTFTLLFIFILLASCSKSLSPTKGNFKLVVGAQAFSAPMNGGVFIQTEDVATLLKTQLKLDQENSIVIPQSTYNILVVAFSGPNEKAGTKFCGSVDGAKLLSATSTVTVGINQSHCSEAKFQEYLIKLLGNNTWDTALFDQGKWGQ